MNVENVITPEIEPLGKYLQKVWRYRSLILTFAYRDLKVKYAQTFLGFFWVLLQPLPSVIIFTFFFGTLIHVDTGLLPYPVFALIGISGWNYFTNLTSSVGNSLVESQFILKKIYFPKIILLLSKILVGGCDFIITFMLIVVAMLFYRVMPSISLVYFPVFLVFNIITGFSIGIWISALTFRYRDLQYIAPYIIVFSVWLTPVFYTTTILPKNVEYLMFFNPMAFVIEGYRFCFAGGQPPSTRYLMSVIPVFILFFTGLWYFRKVEDDIADFV